MFFIYFIVINNIDIVLYACMFCIVCVYIYVLWRVLYQTGLMTLYMIPWMKINEWMNECMKYNNTAYVQGVKNY
jgi:hypothetical protein